MKWSRLAVTVAVVLALVWVGALMFGSERSSPAEILDQVRERFAGGDSDGRQLVRELQRAFDDPRSVGQEDLLAELLLCRSEVYASIGDLASARGDLQRVLTLYRKGDPALELRAAELEAAEGRLTEALARVHRLAARDPRSPASWRLIGRLERERADALLEQATRLAAPYLVGRKSEQVTEILRELGARDPDDRARRPLADDLRQRLPSSEPELFKQLLDASDAASNGNRAARRALARALQAGVEARTAQAMIELLARAGRPDLAVDLATAARLDPAVHDDGGVLEATLDALTDLGHLERSSLLIQRWPWAEQNPSATLCHQALAILYEAGDSRRMGPVLAALRRTGGTGTAHIASFYQAIQLTDRGEARDDPDLWNAALRRWTDFLDGGLTLDPLPGARALAYAQRARVRRALGDQKGERADLLRALTPPLEFASEVWLSHVTGKDYKRMSTLTAQAPNAGYRRPEERWTRAMSMLPASWEGMMAGWEGLGTLSLQRDAGYTLDQVMQSAFNIGSPWPTVDVGPNTLYRVSLEHLRLDNHEAALRVARALVREYPGLVPAWDVVIEAQIRRGSRMQVMVDLLDRLALTGPDPTTARFLAALGEAALRPDQRLEWMRLDPTDLGRRTMAEHLLGAGDAAGALRALGPAPDEPAGEAAQLRVLRARALLELGRHEPAVAALPGTADDPGLAAMVLAIELRAVLASRGALEVQPIVDRIAARLEDEAPPSWVALEAVRRLLAAGQPGPAGQLLEALDARRATRGGEVLEAMTLHRLAIDDRPGALEALERAEAFFGDGRVELRRVLLAIDDRAWRGLPARALAARVALGEDVDPWLDAALALLEERLEAGAALAREGLARDPRSPQWSLLLAIAADLAAEPIEVPAYLGRAGAQEVRACLRGGDAIGRDPREVLGLLIAIEHAGWASWAGAAVADLRARQGGVLWPAWLQARALELQGELDDAQRAYQRLAGESPDFGPAWDGWERCLVAVGGTAWSGKRVELRAGRFEALAGAGGTALERAIDEACALALGGDRRAGLDRIMRQRGEAGELDDTAKRLLAYLHLANGEYKQAAAAYQAALPDGGNASDDPTVERLVATLRLAALPGTHKQARLEVAQVEAALDDLARRFPHDPLPVLEWARMRSESEQRNPALVVEMITRAFESLRERARGLPLNGLRPGAAEAWGEFLVEIAPDVLEQALLQDLAVTPGDLTLWRLLAQTVAAQGRSEDARDLYQALVAMSDDPASRQAFAWFLLATGGSRGEVTAQLDAARAHAQDAPQDQMRARFVAALAELQFSDNPRLPVLTRTLGDLWERRLEARSVPTLQLGRAYVSCLLLRRQGMDRRVLSEVLGELAKATELDPYVGDLARAIDGIHQALPPRAPGGGGQGGEDG